MHMDAYRAQQQGYGHPLTIIHVQKAEQRGKTTWGKSSLKKDMRGKPKNDFDSAPN